MLFLGLFSPWSRRVATVAVLIWWTLLSWQHRAVFQTAAVQAGVPRVTSEIQCVIKNGASAAAICSKIIPQPNQQRQK
ncbi:hypothetical protein P3T23_008047 [Paraburkholderia sp. GAS448]